MVVRFVGVAIIALGRQDIIKLDSVEFVRDGGFHELGPIDRADVPESNGVPDLMGEGVAQVE